MFYIASTRFSNATYEENWKYRRNHKIRVIYGSSIRIRSKYPVDAVIVVVEMNNDKNKIEGIGVIRNKLVHNCKIYSNSDYNRYVYMGQHWISRDDIIDLCPDLVEMLELVLFKGKTHMKRLLGITIITPKLFRYWSFEYVEVEKEMKLLFQKRQKLKNKK